ncbi:Bgt-50960 [Blumeria graminis f. sp. tritici]|uniref:Bgt-50960 n=1 Tax=Blumeria graminis f. sp. tritici TaxID=62690 RepID=A0A9X9LA09_BLUGR|nr:Bgt-50960 [Blumeria graminis f. sp. tritici]
MNCIYAMLLLQNSISEISDRVVFTGSNIIINVEKIYTEVYRPFNGGFPKPEDGTGVFMAIDESRTPGAHHAIYCTRDMLFQDMMSRIMVGSQPLSDEDIIYLDKDHQAVEECHEYLQNLPQEIGTVNPLRLSTAVNSGKCTARSIATLAFEHRVSVVGYYGSFAPIFRSPPIKIDADYAVKVEDLVLPNQSFIFKRSNATRAIVWYQGKVHVLEKCRGNKSEWYFISDFNFTEFPLNLSIILRYFNESVGESKSLVEQSELSTRWNQRKNFCAVGPPREYPYRTKVKLIKKSPRPQTVPGVLIDKYNCASYMG